MNALFRHLQSYAIPILLAVTYLALVLSSDMAPIPAVLTLAVFGMVMVLWSVFRELQIHATASRLAAVGEPDELLELADRELARRYLARTSVPFMIYRSIAFQLRGDWVQAGEALEQTRLEQLSSKARRTWTLMHAEQRINVLAEAGDAAGARNVLEKTMRPFLIFIPGEGAKIIAKQAEARVLLVEGKPAEARELYESLARDIRLGPAIRGLCHHYLARCLEADDPSAARAADAEAAKLAPNTWLGAAVQNDPTNTTPAESAPT